MVWVSKGKRCWYVLKSKGVFPGKKETTPSDGEEQTRPGKLPGTERRSDRTEAGDSHLKHEMGFPWI